MVKIFIRINKEISKDANQILRGNWAGRMSRDTRGNAESHEQRDGDSKGAGTNN